MTREAVPVPGDLVMAKLRFGSEKWWVLDRDGCAPALVMSVTPECESDERSFGLLMPDLFILYLPLVWIHVA